VYNGPLSRRCSICGTDERGARVVVRVRGCGGQLPNARFLFLSGKFLTGRIKREHTIMLLMTTTFIISPIMVSILFKKSTCAKYESRYEREQYLTPSNCGFCRDRRRRQL
jgi:hypothetical protein